MPFTTLQDRALQIPRQVIGAQYPKANFRLGEVHTILPPVGHSSINCQGHIIPPEGKKLQITNELVPLIQAGFVRIASDTVGPDADKYGVSGPASADGVDSSLTTGDMTSSPVSFSSVEEIQACQDREKIRLFVFNENGIENLKAPIEGLRDLAIKILQEKAGG
jgi:hypothetical protein